MINKTRIKCQSKTDTIGRNAHTYVCLWMYLKQKAINIDGETRSRNSEGEKKWKWQPENFLMDILIFNYIVDFEFSHAALFLSIPLLTNSTSPENLLMFQSNEKFHQFWCCCCNKNSTFCMKLNFV